MAILRFPVFALFALAIAFGLHDLSLRGAAAIEQVLAARVENGLAVLGLDWAKVEADGLVIELYGNAPDPEAQSLAVEASRSIARFGRVINRTSASLAPPERRPSVRVEFHRDDEGLTLIGQLHDDAMRKALLRAIEAAEPGLVVHDLSGLDAAHPGRDWGSEVAAAIAAVRMVPRAFVRLEPGSLLIEGVAADQAERERMEGDLLRLAGPNIAVTTAIRVPSRVISPFLFAAGRTARDGLRLVACAARTEAEGTEIDALIEAAGIANAPPSCPVGLGGPHGDWVGAVRAALKALSVLPAGRVEVSHRAVVLEAAPPTDESMFEAVLASLSIDLPPGFDLSGAVVAGAEVERARREKESFWLRFERHEGAVSLAGVVGDEPSRRAIEALAAARFGRAALSADLAVAGRAAPAGWQEAAIAALDALEGVVGVAEITARGLTLRARVDGAAAARALHDRVGAQMPEAMPLRTVLSVDLPALVADLPLAPGRCLAELNDAVARRQIQFDPGSVRMDEASREAVGVLAGILRRCPDVAVEIGGHTDDQGSEELNLRLSKGRAEAVLDALVEAGIGPGRMTARGYGEAAPIAPNDTPEGRALNRRIAFTLTE